MFIQPYNIQVYLLLVVVKVTIIEVIKVINKMATVDIKPFTSHHKPDDCFYFLT